MDTIGDRIRQARKGRGDTQTDWAALAGVAQSTVVRWEQGRMSPGAVELARVCSATGLCLACIVLGPDNPRCEDVVILERDAAGLVTCYPDAERELTAAMDGEDARD